MTTDCEHETSINETGYGFGELEYFCVKCGKRVKSVPLAELDAEGRAKVAAYGVYVADFESRP